MTTVNTLVLISSEQRAHITRIDPTHPGRTSSRAVRLGFEFMHTPIRDFALFCHCLDGTVTRERWAFAADLSALERAEHLKWDWAGEQVPVPLDRDLHETAVNHFTALDLEPLVGFSICLWYGLLAYNCKIRSLREMIWPHYPRRADVPRSILLNDGVTYGGMAHIAGTHGLQADTRCQTCKFYQHRKNARGEELYGSCDKYASLMGAGPTPKFPSHARACKYYEEKADAE